MRAPLARHSASRAGAKGGAALAAALALAAGASWAQQHEALPDVVISASSLGLTEAAVGQHVDVFTREQLESRPAASVGEFLLRQAGVMVDRPGRSGGFGSLYLRGADPSHVVVLIDGVRQNDPLSSRGSAVDLNSLSLDDIERIEVIRGNTTVAHGEAMAGVVALYTSVGGAQRRSISTELGGDGLRALAASLQLPSWRLSASHRQDGNDGTGSIRIDALNLGFRERTEHWAVQVDLRLADALNRSFPDDSGGARFAAARGLETNDMQSRQLPGQLRRDLGALGSLQLGLQLFARHSDQDTPGVAPGPRDPVGLPPLRARADYDRVAGRLEWLTSTRGWDLLVGLESQHEHGELDSVIFIDEGVPAAFAITRQTNSVFAEARRTAGRLSYQLGLRSESTPGQGSVTHPALGVQYQLPDAWGRIGGGLSSAAKLPSFFALGHPFVGNPQLTRESTRQAEAYYARDWDDGSRARLTAFKAKYLNLVDFDVGPPPKLVNRSAIDATGIEFTWRGSLDMRTAMRVQGTVMEVTRPAGGDTLRFRPRHQWLIGLETHPSAGWEFTGDLVHVGQRVDSSIPTGEQTLEAHTDLRLSLAWRSAGWSVYGAIDNALGGDGEEVIGTPRGGRRLRLGVRCTL
jgi:vitamin B12 transporter